MSDSENITLLLNRWNDGNDNALDELLPIVYSELRRIARNQMRWQASGHTLQTTELIHEAYLKLSKQDEHKWNNREHFFGVAAKAMRHILVDYARKKNREKRGGNQIQVTLDDQSAADSNQSVQIIALDEALQKLAETDKRKVEIVEMKYFGGMTFDEISNALDVSTKTIQRDWRFARMWLLREIQGDN